MAPLSVLEFYSGIGGMHYALEAISINYKILGAIDINTLANDVYRHNFPETNVLQKNIEGLTVEVLDKLSADMWTMSPPCQPYTRQGKQENSLDARAKSFLHILDVLSKMENPPMYVFMENVKGFELSDTRNNFLSVLEEQGYIYQEFLISPNDFGIPNSRMRYYLLASHDPSLFSFSCTKLPLQISNQTDEDLKCKCVEIKSGQINHLECVCKVLANILGEFEHRTLSDFIVTKNNTSSEYLLDQNMLLRFYVIFDVVDIHSTHSCCFTKAYGKYIKGTGSILTENLMEEVKEVYEQLTTITSEDEKLQLLLSLNLRYFTPDEIAHLLCFPDSFKFPGDVLLKQKYRLLGNSVNVDVIAKLMKWVFLIT